MSKYLARGPSASFGPTIQAVSNMVGRFVNFIVCFPNFSKKSSPYAKVIPCVLKIRYIIPTIIELQIPKTKTGPAIVNILLPTPIT